MASPSPYSCSQCSCHSSDRSQTPAARTEKSEQQRDNYASKSRSSVDMEIDDDSYGPKLHHGSDIQIFGDKTLFKRLMNIDDSLFHKMTVSKDNHTDLTEKPAKISRLTQCDPYHVYMPFYPKKGSSGRWEEIKHALRSLAEGRVCIGGELKELILRYNGSNRSKWNFEGLQCFLNDLKSGSMEWVETFGTLSKMAKLALQVEDLVQWPIPFLKKGCKKSIALSKKQIACLLAHAFFCTYPMRNVDPANGRNSDALPLPSINFSTLFQLYSAVPVTWNKLKCIFHYFKRVTADGRDYEMEKKVVFKRQSVKPSESISWKKSQKRFTELCVTTTGRIEAEYGMLQVDFANKFIGGGVLGRGCVQEEIWFLVSPELIISRLFTEALDDNEVLIITGSEIYSRHRGYANTFEWEGDYIDQTKSVEDVKLTQMVAMDAKKFYKDEEQFDMNIVDRELNKAYCGFYYDGKEKERPDHLPAVATGNWGCGAFGGDKHLKSLIQMMAAAEAGRDVCYITHGDHDLADTMSKVHQLIGRHSLTVGNVYTIISNYVEQVKRNKGYFYSNKLFDYILSTYTTTETLSWKSNEKETAV